VKGGLRLSEPVYARVENCVLDHPTPHIWIRKNELLDRKNKSSIRAVPLVGVSLFAAKCIRWYAAYPSSFICRGNRKAP
jgi:hypothetical protein